jgi:glutamate synthase (NADPH/NADH) large chain
MGDGCGILVQIPHRFFAAECAKLGIWLPEAGQYGVGHLFMPRNPEGFRLVEEIVAKAIADEGLQLLGWRDVPVDSSDLGESVKATEPLHRQIFIGKGKGMDSQETFERRLFLARKVISNAVYDMKDGRTAGYYPVSLSSRTIVYKGMVLVRSSATTTSTCRIRASRAPSPWCTSASPPTPSRPGSSLIPTGWSPITARSTRSAAT